MAALQFQLWLPEIIVRFLMPVQFERSSFGNGWICLVIFHKQERTLNGSIFVVISHFANGNAQNCPVFFTTSFNSILSSKFLNKINICEYLANKRKKKRHFNSIHEKSIITKVSAFKFCDNNGNTLSLTLMNMKRAKKCK